MPDHPPVLRLLAAFSRYPEALEWAAARSERAWGACALVSERFAFRETRYYESSMGPDLWKQFWAFEMAAGAGELANWKLASGQWEAEYAALGRHPEPRPLNLDPGYLTAAKLVLASTKDFAHRIYLGQGIFAEVTLLYRDRRWQAHEWTFPDYRRADYQAFFTACRELLRQRPG